MFFLKKNLIFSPDLYLLTKSSVFFYTFLKNNNFKKGEIASVFSLFIETVSKKQFLYKKN